MGGCASNQPKVSYAKSLFRYYYLPYNTHQCLRTAVHNDLDSFQRMIDGKEPTKLEASLMFRIPFEKSDEFETLLSDRGLSVIMNAHHKMTIIQAYHLAYKLKTV